jgi:hypothetical protein
MNLIAFHYLFYFFFKFENPDRIYRFTEIIQSLYAELFHPSIQKYSSLIRDDR